MKTLFIALASLTTMACANPVATAIVEKTWERCVICAGEESSTVSCAVGYKGKMLLDAPFYVSVPVILPTTMLSDLAKVGAVINARLEIGGKVYEPCTIAYGSDPLLPDGTVKADCKFVTRGVPGKSFAMVVSYEQPTINGRVYYLPQFEGGKNPKDFAEFSVSFFPTKGGTLTLESKHEQEATAFATRVNVKLVHNELITVKYTHGKQASSAKPESKTADKVPAKDQPSPQAPKDDSR